MRTVVFCATAFGGKTTCALLSGSPTAPPSGRIVPTATLGSGGCGGFDGALVGAGAGAWGGGGGPEAGAPPPPLGAPVFELGPEG
jgi:hypothetical protein